MPLAPIFDTVGWFSQNAEVFERVGQVLLNETPSLKKPSGFLLAEDLLPLLEPSARDAITAALHKQLAHGPYESSKLYGNGNAGERIADALARSRLSIEKRLAY